MVQTMTKTSIKRINKFIRLASIFTNLYEMSAICSLRQDRFRIEKDITDTFLTISQKLGVRVIWRIDSIELSIGVYVVCIPITYNHKDVHQVYMRCILQLAEKAKNGQQLPKNPRNIN